jgi:DNA-binding transcriptional ArsR family regulator
MSSSSKVKAGPKARFLPPPDKLEKVARLLATLGNERRLEVLCLLGENGEMNVSELLSCLDLSQSALSQHLSKLRADRFVESRRDGLNIYYRVEREDLRQILNLLHELYC